MWRSIKYLPLKDCRSVGPFPLVWTPASPNTDNWRSGTRRPDNTETSISSNLSRNSKTTYTSTWWFGELFDVLFFIFICQLVGKTTWTILASFSLTSSTAHCKNLSTPRYIQLSTYLSMMRDQASSNRHHQVNCRGLSFPLHQRRHLTSRRPRVPTFWG